MMREREREKKWMQMFIKTLRKTKIFLWRISGIGENNEEITISNFKTIKQTWQRKTTVYMSNLMKNGFKMF